MDKHANFYPRCTADEAISIMENASFSLGNICYDCYIKAYNKENECSIWEMYKALTAIYMMGFLSGSRAIRKKSKYKERYNHEQA